MSEAGTEPTPCARTRSVSPHNCYSHEEMCDAECAAFYKGQKDERKRVMEISYMMAGETPDNETGQFAKVWASGIIDMRKYIQDGKHVSNW